MSGTARLSWRPIEPEDVPSCAVLLAAIEEADQTGDVFGEEDLLETFRHTAGGASAASCSTSPSLRPCRCTRSAIRVCRCR